MKKATREIFEIVGHERGMNLSCYCPRFLEKTIVKRMEDIDEKNFSRYQVLIKGNESERSALYNLIHNHHSAFFRDPFTFNFIEKKLLPKIAMQKKESKTSDVRVWSAGCASGEEPYSIAILFNEFAQDDKNRLELTLFATDIDDSALRNAKRARYGIESMENIRYSLVNRYFQVGNGEYELTRKIRKMVAFSKFDITHPTKMAPENSVFTSFDMISCRNLLIYINKTGREMVFKKLHSALETGGFLVLGECEIVEPAYQHMFEQVDDEIHIYRKL